MFVEFMGATQEIDDVGVKSYTERGLVAINWLEIISYYDHTIITPHHTIKVMETYQEIKEKISASIAGKKEKNYAENVQDCRG